MDLSTIIDVVEFAHSAAHFLKEIDNNTMAPKVDIDNEKLINSLNEVTLYYCLDKIVSTLKIVDFNSQTDGKKYLIEQIIRTERDVSDDIGKYWGSAKLYSFLLKLYYESCINCKENTRASIYYNRGMKLLDEIGKTTTFNINHFIDALVIFLSLFRSQTTNDVYKSDPVQFEFYEADYNTIEYLYRQSISSDIKIKRLMNIPILIRTRKFFFIISVLLFGLILQINGSIESQVV